MRRLLILCIYYVYVRFIYHIEKKLLYDMYESKSLRVLAVRGYPIKHLFLFFFYKNVQTLYI